MDIKQIRLGAQYWCVFKVTAVESPQDYPQHVMHIGRGYVTSKGVQVHLGADRGSEQLYVEICNQRLKADCVFDTPEGALAKLDVMINEMAGMQAQPENAVPPEA